MDISAFPTKGNLMAAKNTLSLSRTGYELLDRKRNILIRELMSLMDRAGELQGKIEHTFSKAYKALENANINMGIEKVDSMIRAVPVEDGIRLTARSVMGVEIPKVSIKERDLEPPFGLYSMTASLDVAYKNFEDVKKMSLQLAEVETCAFRLAVSIKKTQKRANALKDIMIPRYEALIANISSSLEEKEREDFTRLKVIKARAAKK